MWESQAAAASWGKGSLVLPPDGGGAANWCRRREVIGGGWDWRRRALGELRDTGIGEIGGVGIGCRETKNPNDPLARRYFPRVKARHD